MRIYFILIFFILNILSVSNAQESSGVVLPDIQIMGKNLKDCLNFLDDKSASIRKSPKQILIDTDNNKIVGIKAVYDTAVSFSEVENSLNKVYRDWQLAGHENSTMRLWRVSSIKVAIQLSLDDSGKCHLYG